MKMRNILGSSMIVLVSLFVMIGFAACSDNDEIPCTSCTLNEETQEVCLDGEITYTDMDGNELPDEEVIAYLESIGYDCN